MTQNSILITGCSSGIGRDAALALHALESPAAYVASDARRDPRLLSNPLVAGPMAVRFYAGAPILLASGAAIGALVVLDTRPRAPTEQDIRRLESLARLVRDVLDMRRDVLIARELSGDSASSGGAGRADSRRFARISHDMRTPLTRMRLALSMMEEDEEVNGLLRDVAEMDRMLEEFLHFTRDGSLDDLEDCDPVEIAREVVEKAARNGADVALDRIEGAGRLRARTGALARALGNLAENGLRHGTKVRLSVSVQEKSATFTVEDDGPGIPPKQRDEALRPFSRLDPARNQDRGSGVGLGLAITNDIARQHGGSLMLGESDGLGGLRADLVVPR